MLALQRNGASIQGQVVNIRLMAREDPEAIRLNNRIQGGEFEVPDFEKCAFTILSYPAEEQAERLKEQLLLLTTQQKDAFIEVYRKCENIVLVQRRVDEAIAACDDQNYVELDVCFGY